MFWVGKIKVRPPELQDTVAGLLGHPVEFAERIGGGRNSQVYRLTGPEGRQYVSKLYFQPNDGERDRLESEFFGLKFLWDNGERAVPRPVAIDGSSRCALYEYVEGTPMASATIEAPDIDQAVELALRLKSIADRNRCFQLPSASEACISVEAIVENINARLARLLAASGADGQTGALPRFLSDQFIPTFDRVVKSRRAYLESNGMDFSSELDSDQRTLSPSDFGFHNAVKRANGDIIFLDFEHFGWDDPAKFVSDFLLHPAMNLSPAMKHRFFAKVLDGFQSCPQLGKRVEAAYPLFGLKWCLILLNEFLPDHMARRGFASLGDLDTAQLRAEQLVKANEMLSRVKREYDHFPYCV